MRKVHSATWSSFAVSQKSILHIVVCLKVHSRMDCEVTLITFKNVIIETFVS